jgi:hypothetical protein
MTASVASGFIPEVFALYSLRHTFYRKKPGWLTSRFYWVITVVMVLFGGGTVCLYIAVGVSLNYLAAIQLGMSTPLLISIASKHKPRVN